MNYNGQVKAVGKNDLLFENVFLNGTGRKIVVIVQTDFTYTHHFFVRRDGGEKLRRFVVEIFCLVRVATHHGVNIVVFFRQVKSLAGGRQVAAAIDNEIDVVGLECGDNRFSHAVKRMVF